MGFQHKKSMGWVGGWAGGVSSIQFNVGFLFTFAKPLIPAILHNKLFSFRLPEVCVDDIRTVI